MKDGDMEKFTVPVEMTMEELEQYEKLAEKNGQPSVQALIISLLEGLQSDWEVWAESQDEEDAHACTDSQAN